LATEADLSIGRLKFAIIHDAPCNAHAEAKFPHLMAAIERTNIAFAVQTGDIKSGANPCMDVLFMRWRDHREEVSSKAGERFAMTHRTACRRSRQRKAVMGIKRRPR
jgi:hypothetical protein